MVKPVLLLTVKLAGLQQYVTSEQSKDNRISMLGRTIPSTQVICFNLTIILYPTLIGLVDLRHKCFREVESDAHGRAASIASSTDR